MAFVERIVQASPERVFAVLADGWTYSDWVVGTAHIREVDDEWPAPGTRLHHKAGPWPFSLQDKSEVLSMQWERELTLSAGLWPLGEAWVQIKLAPVGLEATRVTMEEEFRAGPLVAARNKLNDLILHGRNREALHRLDDLACGRTVPSRPSAT